MRHERRKAVIGMLQSDLENVFVERPRAETVWRRKCGNSAFDVGEQFCMWCEWSNLERAFPGAHEIFRRNFLAVGPACVVAQVERPDAIIVRRLPPRCNSRN